MTTVQILVAVPTRGRVDWQTVTQLQTIRDNTPGLPPIHYESGGMGPVDVRNRIVAGFLATHYEALIMIDDDVMPPLRVIELADRLDEWPIIACPTLIVKDGRLLYSAYDAAGMYVLSGKDVTEVAAVGTGCICVSRDVLELMHPAFRFGLDEDGAVARTEDIEFSLAAGRRGFRIGVDWTLGLADHRVHAGLGQFALAMKPATVEGGE